MELIAGVVKEDYSDYVLYFIEVLSAELKQEIRDRLVKVCRGFDQAQSERKIYSYKETVKEFIKRYKTNNDLSEDRKKGMIGELLVHVILDIEGRFITASPFFNMEERSFKKGFDVSLFESDTNELWITEVKSGKKQKRQANASSAIVGLINTAKNDLNTRLNEQNTNLWINAIHAAQVSMSGKGNQKDAVVRLLEQCADDAVDGNNSSNSFNVVLAGTLFHPMSERMEASKVKRKYTKITNENLFKKIFIMALQKETFEAVYDFLESEANDET
nr:Hachiman antiphage defense system protein HamA [uncultured Anaerotignum sp.]